jgi:ADP-heptose:LPS heptosyltransferase
MARPVVLILRALGLGDGLTGIPALRGLRRAFGPEARLVLAAPAGIGGWLVERGVVDEVLVTPDLDDVVASWRAAHAGAPEVAVDLHGRGPRSHRLLQQLSPGRLIAWRCPEAGHDQGPEHVDSEHEVLRWCRLVTATTGAPCGPSDLFLSPPGAPGDPDDSEDPGDCADPDDSADPGDFDDPETSTAFDGHVLVHPGAASGSRRWPAERFADVVRSLAAGGDRVVLTGSADEAELVAAVAATTPGVRRLAGRVDLDGLAAVVARARLVVCGDTGVAHLATAYRVPSVLLFGPTPPAEWGPCVDLDRHRVLWHGPRFVVTGESANAPGYRGDPHGPAVDPALDDIGVAEVLRAVARLHEPATSDPERPEDHSG